MSVPFSLVAAVAENGVIGKDNALPWRLSTDLKRFRALTLARPVIMGRKTWESLGRPLPRRLNIVISRDRHYKAEGAVVVHSLAQAREAALEAAGRIQAGEIFVIGGGEIFRQAVPFADKMYMTEILAPVDGDAFFPRFDRSTWQAVFSRMIPAGEKDSHPTRFVIYERRAPVTA